MSEQAEGKLGSFPRLTLTLLCSPDHCIAYCLPLDYPERDCWQSRKATVIAHFTTVCLAIWPLSGSEVQTFLLFTCKLHCLFHIMIINMWRASRFITTQSQLDPALLKNHSKARTLSKQLKNGLYALKWERGDANIFRNAMGCVFTRSNFTP